jgi:hypothetical protein
MVSRMSAFRVQSGGLGMHWVSSCQPGLPHTRATLATFTRVGEGMGLIFRAEDILEFEAIGKFQPLRMADWLGCVWKAP